MRHFKPIVIALAIIFSLIVLSFVFSLGTSETRDRKIAEELLELHDVWDTNINNVPSFYASLTNLPFHQSGVVIQNGLVSRRYSVLGIKWEQNYFICQPTITNESEWTLYRAWYWYPPGGHKKELATRELVTITN